MPKQTTFLDQLFEEFDSAVVVGEEKEVDVIPTSSMALDMSIGIGGIPRGKITEIYGPEGSGKTTLALGIVKNCIIDGGRALYIDAENMLDYGLLKGMIGEDLTPDKFVIVTPETAEDAFRMAEIGMSSGEFTLVVIDSIGALAPKKEKEDDFGDANVALVPRLVSKFLRRNATGSVAQNNVALVLLNQVRDKIGAYMATYETPGGHALKHFTSLRIALSKGQEIKVGNEVIGILSKFVIKKNKMSAPFRGFFLPILFGKGVDTYTDAIDYCSMLGVIKKSGSFYKFEGENLGQGKIAAAETLKATPGLLDKLREMVYNVLNQNTSVTLEIAEELLEEGEEDE